ncbi:hypothetical protein [Streptomyces sp. SAS_276]|uniref:hypothetical protein n=1 Tax=Streptomyces sp. SAS_276 TaxID=3412745 RepID=UPI00403C359D
MILNSFLIKKWAASDEEDDRMNATSPAARFLARLEGPYDFWDRPDGDWGSAAETGCGDDVREARGDANSSYRIGTKALRRGELATARAAFAVAMDEQHPGAAFRMAITELFLGQHRQERLVLTVACGSGKTAAFVWLIMNHLDTAARWGHEDARRLISRIRPSEGRSPIPDNAPTWSDHWADCVLSPEHEPYEVQDHEFYPDVCEYLESLLPAADSSAGSNMAGGAQEQQASQPALVHGLVLIGDHGGGIPPLPHPAIRAEIASLAAWGGTDKAMRLGAGGQVKTGPSHQLQVTPYVLRDFDELLSRLMQRCVTQSGYEWPAFPSLDLAHCAVILDPDPAASCRELHASAIDACRLRCSRRADVNRNETLAATNIASWAGVMSAWTRTAPDIWPMPFTLRATKVLELPYYGDPHEAARGNLAEGFRVACSRCPKCEGSVGQALPYPRDDVGNPAGEIAFNATSLTGASVREFDQNLLVFGLPFRCRDTPTQRFGLPRAEHFGSLHALVSECTECGQRLAGTGSGLYVSGASAEPPSADPLSSPEPVGSLAGAWSGAEESA